MKRTVLVFGLISLVLIPLAGLSTWTGATSRNWSTASNWSPAGVPTSTTDVIVNSAGVTNFPWIAAASYCQNLYLETGASLTVNAAYNLNISAGLYVAGTLNMSSTGMVNVAGDVEWEPGGTANITSNTRINVTGNMTFFNGSNVNMSTGIFQFQGNLADTHIINNDPDTAISTLWVAKTAGIFSISASSTQPLTLNGNITNYSGSSFYHYYTGNTVLKGSIFDNNADGASPGIKWNSGTLVLDGTSATIGLQNSNCYLKNLTFSQTGTAQLSYPLTLKGNLQIDSGVFATNSHTVEIAGNWANTVGPAAFTEGTGMVVFNGSAHQYCNFDEEFYLLEVDKSGGALRVNNSNAEVYAAYYNWTAGAIDVLQGIFSAGNLIDSGIVGGYYVNPGGTINLSNYDGSVDLNALVTFTNGGTINVYGGTTSSSYSNWQNANLTMSGGSFVFHDVGININGSSGYTFALNVTGGTISTSGNFYCTRNIAPVDGTLELTGTTERFIYMDAGALGPCSLANLKINKTAAAIYLATDVTCTGDILVQSGTLAIQDEVLSCDLLDIYGTLNMANALGRVYTSGSISWYSGSVAALTAGEIECGQSWNIYNSASVVIPAAVLITLKSTLNSYINIEAEGSQLGSLVVGGATPGSGFDISSFSDYDLHVAGYLTITQNNSLDLFFNNLTVDGNLILYGTLDLHTNDATVHGKPYLYATSTLVLGYGTFYCDESTVLPRTTYLNGTLSINAGEFKLAHHTITVNAGSITTIEDGYIYCDGINATSAGTFQPNGGTVVLTQRYGGGSYTLNISGGNWLPSVTVQDYYRLGADLTVKGDMMIDTGGTLDVMNSSSVVFTITVAGNWIHFEGTFLPRTGRVIFNGSGHQYCSYTESFNILEVDKSGGALRVNNAAAVVTIAQYDWTAGALDVLGGALTILDLADNGMYGGFYCNTGGTLNISQDNSQTIDLNGTLQITGGTVNVSGGTGAAFWGYDADASITISGGSLNYLDQGVYIFDAPSHNLSYNITGGKVTLARNLSCNQPGFAPAGGVFELVGPLDSYIYLDGAGSSFYQITINKSSAPDGAGGPGSDPIPTRSNLVYLFNDITCRGNVIVDHGRLELNGNTLNCAGNLTVRNGSTLELDAAAVLAMGGGSTLAIYSGSQIDVLGNADNPATFTHYGDGYYAFTVRSGGTLSANYVVFEYMNSDGVNFQSGSLTGGLHNCTFRYGQTIYPVGGALLKLNNNQEITITGAVFPVSTGANNVWKELNAGIVRLYLASGAFAGSAFENDTYDRIFWTGNDVDLEIIDVYWNRPDNYVCAPLTATVSVRNNGSHDIAGQVRVDLYKNLPTAPPAGTPGDLYQEMFALEAGHSKSVVFQNLSTDAPGNWNSWLRVDATGLIAETNESNNLWTGTLATEWLPLPVVEDLQLTRLSGFGLQLNWTYPITANRYNLYRDTSPYFTPGPENLWITVTGTLVNTVALQDRFFYLVRAERDLP